MPAVSLPLCNKPLKPFAALLILALMFGTLDIMDGMLFWGLSMDVGPADVLQGIASGLLGQDAYHGGLGTAALGALIQYCGFFCLLGFSRLLAARFPVFGESPMAFGLGYGLAGFFVIHYLILPMTAFHIVAGFYPGVFANALLAQTLSIGLPVAYLAGMGTVKRTGDPVLHEHAEARQASASR